MGLFFVIPSAKIITRNCNPDSVLCESEGPSIWMYTLFFSAAVILISGLLQLYIAYIRGRQVVHEVRADAGKSIATKPVSVSRAVPTAQVQPKSFPKFLPENFEAQFAAALRSHAFYKCEDMLLALAPAVPQPIFDACQRARSGLVIEGWQAAETFIIRTEKRTETHATAVSLDLTAHGEEEDGSPSIEFSVYDDGAYPFSSRSQAETAAEMVGGSTPWQGCFLDIDQPLTVKGLGEIHALIEGGDWGNYHSDPHIYASLWRRLLFEQAVRRDLLAGKLALKLIVVTGTHDLTGDIVCAHFPVSAKR